jgi:hypothetical protein
MNNINLQANNMQAIVNTCGGMISLEERTGQKA